ncbi:DnaB-like helicase N-terminal domain-containing protein [Sulfurimonas sp. HSL-1716]|uniref:DnaB-like helicase N-terminal domain-containing protein n=1 Tax=Hydrocurvibacter sulfurireducens TaxID=3131937 RepID=UPI0031F961D1
MHDNLYNLVFEKSVLSSVLFSMEEDERDEIFSRLHTEIFYLPSHRDIYDAMHNLYRSNKPIDEEFIKLQLSKQNKFDEAVMLDILSANPIANVTSYIDQIVEYAKKRKMLELATSIKKMILEDQVTTDEVQAMIDMELQKMEESSDIGMPITMRQAIYDYDNMVEPPKIATGIRKFDEMLCDGIEPAQLVHVGGERNVGKTTLLKQILFNTSVGFNSLFFSFEMPAWKMAKLTKRMKGQSNLDNYRIIDTSMMKSRDVMDVARMIRMMWRKHGIRFVLIDSKMKLTHKTFKGNSDSDRKGDIDAVLNAVVQETGITLMMIVQLSKDDIKNGTMSSYGSGLSDYEADMQIMVYHSQSGDGSVEVKVTKERQDVNHEPIKLWLNRDELKFDDVRRAETTYTVTRSGIQETFNDKVEIQII